MNYEYHRCRVDRATHAPCNCIWCVRAEQVIEQENLRGRLLNPAQRHAVRSLLALEAWSE